MPSFSEPLPRPLRRVRPLLAGLLVLLSIFLVSTTGWKAGVGEWWRGSWKTRGRATRSVALPKQEGITCRRSDGSPPTPP